VITSPPYTNFTVAKCLTHIGTEGLALMVAWLMGKATELTGQHRHYQVNTVRDRIVLSTIFIGLKVIDDPRLTLRLADLLAAINCLDELIQNHCLSE
jgi:hypothetical protein